MCMETGCSLNEVPTVRHSNRPNRTTCKLHASNEWADEIDEETWAGVMVELANTVAIWTDRDGVAVSALILKPALSSDDRHCTSQ